jgi:hypothetical protein
MEPLGGAGVPAKAASMKSGGISSSHQVWTAMLMSLSMVNVFM